MLQIRVPDIQHTEELSGSELVREINDRFRGLSESLNTNFRSIQTDLDALFNDVALLTLISSIRTTTIDYKNSTTYDLGTAHTNYLVNAMKFVAEDATDVTVDAMIDGVRITGTPAFPVTLNAGNSYEETVDCTALNALVAGDILQVRTTAGTNNDTLYIATSIFYSDFALPQQSALTASGVLDAFSREGYVAMDRLIVTWDDLRFPASGLNPPGQLSDPDIDTDNGTFLFDKNSTELVSFQAQMPHAWQEGSEIIPHVHWTKTDSTGGDVYWKFEYKHVGIGDVIDAAWTSDFQTATSGGTPDNDTEDEHLISKFDPIDMTGLTISHVLLCRISRIGGEAADDYDADARLLEIDIHFQRDSRGSHDEFIK